MVVAKGRMDKMTTLAMPYFLTNEKWYKKNPEYETFSDKPQFLLTDEAPPRAVDSYKKYLKDIQNLEKTYESEHSF